MLPVLRSKAPGGVSSGTSRGMPLAPMIETVMKGRSSSLLYFTRALLIVTDSRAPSEVRGVGPLPAREAAAPPPPRGVLVLLRGVSAGEARPPVGDMRPLPGERPPPEADAPSAAAAAASSAGICRGWGVLGPSEVAACSDTRRRSAEVRPCSGLWLLWGTAAVMDCAAIPEELGGASPLPPAVATATALAGSDGSWNAERASDSRCASSWSAAGCKFQSCCSRAALADSAGKPSATSSCSSWSCIAA
mmetsp:Transcript_7645/g.22648  ORF Transcript_7645/g.22648 Transcript_7645/m.22648 type:complete len:248 (+) Transcript_7645:846-1589(+)